MNGVTGAYINLGICFLIPLGVLVFLLIARRRLVFPFAVGVLTFAVSQVLLRLPLLSLLNTQSWFLNFSASQPVLYIVLIGGLTAGIFEEGGRWLAMRFVLNAKRGPLASGARLGGFGPLSGHTGWANAAAFGIGHGGFEAAWLVGREWIRILLAQYVPLLFVPMWSVAPSGVERILAMGLHVGMSMLVMKAVRDRKPAWLLLSVLVHTAANSASVLTMAYTQNAWLSEAALALCVLVLFALLAILYKREVRHEKNA